MTASPYGEPREHRFQGRHASLCYFEWGDAGAPPVLLVHATGFHARVWDQTVAALPPGYHVYAVDMRGHGRSERVEPYVWDSFGGDLREFVEYLDLQDAVGVGHSMGGHCVTQVAGTLADRQPFRHLVLVDPVIFEPEAYRENRYRGFDGPEDHPVARRRDHWTDWQEMFDRFRDRKPFCDWRPAALADYCRYGVVPAADGDGFELACPPLVEASVYLGNTETDIYALIPRIRIPVAVLRAKPREADEHGLMDFSKSPTWPAVAAQFPHGRDVYLPELTHFIPFQDPDLVARFIVDPQAQP